MPLINISATFIVEKEDSGKIGLPESEATKARFVEHLKDLETWKAALVDMVVNELVNFKVEENEEKTGFKVEVTLDVGDDEENEENNMNENVSDQAYGFMEVWNEKGIYQEWFGSEQDIDGYKFNAIEDYDVQYSSENMAGGKRRKSRKTRKTRKASRKTRKARKASQTRKARKSRRARRNARK